MAHITIDYGWWMINNWIWIGRLSSDFMDIMLRNNIYIQLLIINGDKQAHVMVDIDNDIKNLLLFKQEKGTFKLVLNMHQRHRLNEYNYPHH